MKGVEGVYRVELLGPYGWESFSTAFVNDGRYRSASADHFTDGVYRVEGERFNMVGNLTKYAEHNSLFGEKSIKGMPIEFKGTICNGVIDGEASALDGSKYSHRFRFNKLKVPGKSKQSGGGTSNRGRRETVHCAVTLP